jgi:hypothetical protein
MHWLTKALICAPFLAYITHAQLIAPREVWNVEIGSDAYFITATCWAIAVFWISSSLRGPRD